MPSVSILPITRHGEKILRKKSEAIDLKAHREELAKLVKDMWDTMHAAHGVGLAAPQIGLAMRLAVIDTKPEGKPRPLVLINPEIVEKEGEVEEEEGCLSIPGLYARVKRYRRVKAKALNQHGIPIEITGEGLLARALQHEIDHLNGKLFIDHLPLFSRLKVQALIRRLKKTWD
jgi:peptide deformylase